MSVSDAGGDYRCWAEVFFDASRNQPAVAGEECIEKNPMRDGLELFSLGAAL